MVKVVVEEVFSREWWQLLLLLFVSLRLMQTLCTTLATARGVWMLFRALDHRDDGMPDPRLEEDYFS